MAPQQRPVKAVSPPTQRLLALLRTQQFYWFVGHLLALSAFAIFQICSFIRPSSAVKYFRYSLISIIATYVIVIANSPGAKTSLPVRLLRDENICYLILAMALWAYSFVLGPMPGSLYSFAIFSLFHAVRYFNANLVSILVPGVPAQQHITLSLNSFLAQYHEMALLLAANAEIILTVMTVVQLPLVMVFRLFKGNIMAVFINASFAAILVVFTKLRYDSNVHTQAIIHTFDARILQFLFQLNSPALSAAYNNIVKGVVIKYVSLIRLPKESSKQK